jgi:hypothetical protein
MFIDKLMNIRLMFLGHMAPRNIRGLCSSGFLKEHKAYVPWRTPRNISLSRKVSLVMFLSFLRNITFYVPRCYVVEKHNLFLMSMWIYVY